VTISRYQVALDQLLKRGSEIHRQLSIVLGQNHMSKMGENELHESRDPWNRPATEVRIFRIPVASLIMYTTQRGISKEIEFYYLTEFTDSIWVSLNIGLYGYLREIATLYSRAAEEDKTIPLGNENLPPVPQSSVLSSGSTPTISHSYSPLSMQSNTDNFGTINVSNSPVSSILPSMKKTPTTQNEDKESRIFVEKKFQLSPTLNVLGDFTPKVATVFGWLGIKDINHTIPYYTHIGLTDPLESTLEILWKVYDTAIEQKEKQGHD